MKITYPLRSIFILCSLLFLTTCVRFEYRKAQSLDEELSYAYAIKKYEGILKKKDIPDVKIRLADCYRYTNNSVKAEFWYERVVAISGSAPIYKFYYAEALMKNEKYAEAKIWLGKYLEERGDDPIALQYERDLKKISELYHDSALYVIQKISINSKNASTFSPVYYKDGIVFASDRHGLFRNVYGWTGNYYLDLYYAAKGEDDYAKPSLLPGDMNKEFHEGSATFTKNGNTIYFSRSNYLDGVLGRSRDNFNNLKIFRATLVNGKWANLEPFPFNSEEYSVGHPALSPDEKEIYFVSDMPGGFGGKDIYVSRLVNGAWQRPENLGATINSAANEMFPFVAEDGTLYFSSDGHGGLGGLDIFASTHNSPWTTPVNLGYPLNSSKDDFGYIINGKGENGLLSSNRGNEMGYDNIYSFTIRPKKVFLKGLVVEKESSLPIEGALVKLFHDSLEIANATTPENGKFIFSLERKKMFSLIASRDKYFAATAKVYTYNFSGDTLFVRLELEKIIIDKPVVLENIYYDFDKHYIRNDAKAELDKLRQILLDNPDIKVELSSHCDSRGTSGYNMNLSKKRAEAAVDFIISRGISSERIRAGWYGKTKLVNHCKEGVYCTKEEHQKNRRTEFKVTGYIMKDQSRAQQ